MTTTTQQPPTPAMPKIPRHTVEMLVTPALAQSWLDNPLRNRPISNTRVDAYARDIAHGAWQMTHQGIGLDHYGRLGDGQHRLSAIVRAGQPVKMQVTFGQDPDEFDSCDLHRVRTHADALARAGIAYSKQYVPRANVIALLLEGAGRNFLTNAERQTYIDKYEAGLEWSAKALPGGKNVETSAVCGALAYAYMVAPAVTDQVASDLKTGACSSDPTDPVLVLRNYINADTGKISKKNASRRGLALRTLRAVMGRMLDEKHTRCAESEIALEFFKDLHHKAGL